MSQEDIKNYINIVESALESICMAEKTIDKKSRDKKIKEAKEKAINMVLPYKLELGKVCNMESIGDDLFSWGNLKSDLQAVCENLKDNQSVR